MFISFEGVDGSGKTTQTQLLAEYLTKKNYDVVLTREPGGGGNFSMDIRNLLSRSDSLLLSELIAIYAARNEHLKKIIIPSLQSGKIVICDRFIDSSIVYFAYEDYKNEKEFKKKLDIIQQLNKIVELIEPDITFLIDINLETLQKRMQIRKHKDKYDNMNNQSMQNIIDLYKIISKKKEKRIIKIEGNRAQNEILTDLINLTIPLLNNK